MRGLYSRSIGVLAVVALFAVAGMAIPGSVARAQAPGSYTTPMPLTVTGSLTTGGVAVSTPLTVTTVPVTPPTSAVVVPGTATVQVSTAPGTCAAYDSWCSYCMEHPGSDVCLA